MYIKVSSYDQIAKYCARKYVLLLECIEIITKKITTGS